MFRGILGIWYLEGAAGWLRIRMRADNCISSSQILKSIAGQSAFQLLVMYATVFHADAVFGVPNAGLADGPSVHYTLVFNTFVIMQLFNQVTLTSSSRPHNIAARFCYC